MTGGEKIPIITEMYPWDLARGAAEINAVEGGDVVAGDDGGADYACYVRSHGVHE